MNAQEALSNIETELRNHIPSHVTADDGQMVVVDKVLPIMHMIDAYVHIKIKETQDERD